MAGVFVFAAQGIRYMYTTSTLPINSFLADFSIYMCVYVYMV